jgi:predicted small lipoprotein YifL
VTVQPSHRAVALATWLLCRLLLAALAGCGQKVRQPLPEAETEAFRACKVDADCTYVNNGCCTCAAGGEDLAIRSDQVNAFRERFVCDQPCDAIAAIPPCGSGTVSCVKQLCTYTPRAAGLSH